VYDASMQRVPQKVLRVSFCFACPKKKYKQSLSSDSSVSCPFEQHNVLLNAGSQPQSRYEPWRPTRNLQSSQSCPQLLEQTPFKLLLMFTENAGPIYMLGDEILRVHQTM